MVAALVKVVVRVFVGKGVAAVVERGHFLMGSLIATPQHNTSGGNKYVVVARLVLAKPKT